MDSGDPQLEDPINVGKGLACGLIFVAAVFWQFRIYGKCRGISRRRSAARDAFFVTFLVPGGLAVFVVILAAIGTIAYGVLAGIDPNRDVEIWPLSRFFLAVCLIAIAFFLKNCVNAALLGATVTWSCYSFLFYGEFSFIPLFRLLFEYFASTAPAWVQLLYTALSLGYALFSAIAASFDGLQLPLVDK